MWVNSAEESDGFSVLDAPIQSCDLRSYIKDQLQAKDERLAQLQEHIVRLQTFADAVRQTFVYRFYRKVLKSFRPE
jgi:hypothetical protein